MLSESFVASLLTSNSSQTTSSTLKDVGICVHEFRPNPSIQLGFKKSTTEPNCLAVNTGHIFAVQSGKAVVHVYSRERNNHEATVPFPERIRSIALAGEEIVVLGTEGGKLILWEICTGRQVMTPATHLQPVTSLIVDPTNNFILSGSEDSNLHVWSLPDLISFSKPSSADQSLAASYSHSPIRTISNHTTAITALAVGHSINRSNIAISTSRDGTALVWEYRTGKILHTYLLPASPLCLAVDPADRAFYVGYEDGSVQLVDFFKAPSVQHVLHDADHQATPTQLQITDKWLPPSSELGATLCVSLSYDGTNLLSGHGNGTVASWDVGRARYAASVASLNSPVTNLHMLQPTGLPQKAERFAIHQIVKPRLDHGIARSSAADAVPATYHLNVHLNASSTEEDDPSVAMRDFAAALSHPFFPSSLLSEGLLQLYPPPEDPISKKSAARNVPSRDASSRGSTTNPSSNTDAQLDNEHIDQLKSELCELKKQLNAHKTTHQSDVKEILSLRDKNVELSDLNSELLAQRQEAERQRAVRRLEIEKRARKRREAWFEAEKKGQNGDELMKDLDVEDSELGSNDEKS